MKKFLQKLLDAGKGWVRYHWQRILRSLPFRMRVGKFGIWLMKVGRFLQVRYANWNSEFRLEREFCPNPDYLVIHVSDVVTQEPILTFGGTIHQEKKQTPMSRELLMLKGIKSITLQPYQISIGKARVFEWREILPKAEETILKHLTK